MATKSGQSTEVVTPKIKEKSDREFFGHLAEAAESVRKSVSKDDLSDADLLAYLENRRG